MLHADSYVYYPPCALLSACASCPFLLFPHYHHNRPFLLPAELVKVPPALLLEVRLAEQVLAVNRTVVQVWSLLPLVVVSELQAVGVIVVPLVALPYLLFS